MIIKKRQSLFGAINIITNMFIYFINASSLFMGIDIVMENFYLLES